MIFVVHETVLKKEAIDALQIKENGCYLDCTGGAGGHSKGILQSLGKNGKLFIFEQDEEAMVRLNDQFKDEKSVQLICDNFSQIGYYFKKNILTPCDGILMDLGISSDHLSSSRGFSFQTDHFLDMRMSQKMSQTAYDVVNRYSYNRLSNIFKKYGEIKQSKKIARCICEQRNKEKIKTTAQLKEIVENNLPRIRKIHPATLVFQAIRIEVNQELKNLETALEKGFDCLKVGGRWVVISFHSLEDRIVKNTFRNWFSKSYEQPNPAAEKIYKKPVRAGADEVKRNPRSRSAILRCIEKKEVI